MILFVPGFDGYLMEPHEKVDDDNSDEDNDEEGEESEASGPGSVTSGHGSMSSSRYQIMFFFYFCAIFTFTIDFLDLFYYKHF